MTVAVDHISGLRTLFVRLIRAELGLHEQLALPLAERLVDGLRRECGGRALRIPAESAAERHQAIRDAHALGLPVGEISRLLDVDRSTVYRALRCRPRSVNGAPTPMNSPLTLEVHHVSHPPA